MASILKHYLILVRHSRFWFVGPFADHDEAAEWGRVTQIEGNDDPRWQTIMLPDEALATAPAVFSPRDPVAVENGDPDGSWAEFRQTAGA